MHEDHHEERGRASVLCCRRRQGLVFCLTDAESTDGLDTGVDKDSAAHELLATGTGEGEERDVGRDGAACQAQYAGRT